MNLQGGNQTEELQNLRAELEAAQARVAHQKQAIAELRHEIDEYRQSEKAHRFYREFQQLITAISTRFISLLSDQIDEGINQAMAMIGAFTGVNRIDCMVQ